jgi:NAD(P)-dependent dehydrogenase (short-subunit alcohol dehydrogenase family)
MAKVLMCNPELFQIDLSGKTYLVTGGNSGIGFVTTQQLAKQGANVIMGCRRPQEGEKAKALILKDHPQAKIQVMEIDLANFDSIRLFANKFLSENSQLHGLVNNAGIMYTPLTRTQQGFESQFGTNHLGHFLLTELLLPILKSSSPSRIAILSSCYHDKAQGREGVIDFQDYNFEQKKYDGWAAYAQSKLANLLHALHLAKVLEGSNVTVASIHPGWVRTNLIKGVMPIWMQDFFLKPFLTLGGMIEPWEGAQTTLHVLLAPEVEKLSGQFFSQTGMYRVKEAAKGGWPLKSPNPHAHDHSAAEKLYNLSRELVGLK